MPLLEGGGGSIAFDQVISACKDVQVGSWSCPGGEYVLADFDDEGFCRGITPAEDEVCS